MTILQAVALAWTGSAVRRPGHPPVYRRGAALYTDEGPYEADYEDLTAEDWEEVEAAG